MNYTTSNNDLKQGKVNHSFADAVNELQAVYTYLQNNVATATQVAVALNIYRTNLCRRKRKLESTGMLAVIKKGICPITKHTAGLLTTNPALFPNRSQLNLF